MTEKPKGQCSVRRLKTEGKENFLQGYLSDDQIPGKQIACRRSSVFVRETLPPN
jgi:hypothetical protein